MTEATSMAGLTSYRLPPPSNWQDFENLCLDLWRKLWTDSNAQKNGRQGQPQSGVDIFGRPGQGELWAGVQCKDKNDLLRSTLTEGDLKIETDNAKTFRPALSEFMVAYTGPRDEALQKKARLLTEENRQQELFSVHVWCWEDILTALNDFPQVVGLHFPHFLPIQRIQVKEPEPVGSSAHAAVADGLSLGAFGAPRPGVSMLEREGLRKSIELSLGSGTSVYLKAPSGYGKSVVLGQLRLAGLAWIDCGEYREFGGFRQHLNKYLKAQHGRPVAEEAPSDFAHSVDHLLKESESTLILALDQIDSVDNGVKAFLQDTVTRLEHVRVVITGSSLHLKREAALKANGRLRTVTAEELAFSEAEVHALITARLPDSELSPSSELATLILKVSHGWPIAVQLLRARLERDPDEDSLVRSLEQIARNELGAYLLDSFWTAVDPGTRGVLERSAIYRIFDRADIQALMPHQNIAAAWQYLTSLPFVSRFGSESEFHAFHQLFRTFLLEQLENNLSREQIQALHRLASAQFLDAKHVPTGAMYHARQSGDALLLARATEAMVDFAFSIGSYETLRVALNTVSPEVRWNNGVLSVHQGRLFEYQKDLTQALKWYRRAEELFTIQGPDYWKVGITNDIGGILRKTGKVDEAIELYTTALNRLPVDIPSVERATLLANRANSHLVKRNFPDAEEGFRAARDIFLLHQDAAGLARLCLGLSELTRLRDGKADRRLALRAFVWAQRSTDASLFLTIALPLAERLMNEHAARTAHRIYAAIMESDVLYESPQHMPMVLNNFGLTGAFLDEPDPKGVGALQAALEMKRSAKVSTGGSLQNLTTLLMRLGLLHKALPVAHEEKRVGIANKDADLEADATAKVLALESFDSDERIEPNLSAIRGRYLKRTKRLMVEGRVRLAIGRQGPLLHEILKSETKAGDDLTVSLNTGATRLRDATPVLVLVAEGHPLETPDGVDGDDDESYLFELLWMKEKGGRSDSTEGAVDAIWWVRKGCVCWVQVFLRDAPKEDGESGVAAMRGHLFRLESDGKWSPADHPENCDCGRIEPHEQMMCLGVALRHARSQGERHDVTLQGQKLLVISTLRTASDAS